MSLISILVPAYNEDKTIEAVLKAIKNTHFKTKYELIVISDGSTDNTARIAKKYARVVILNKNGGKGNAIKAGLEKSKGDIILLLDADLIGLRERHIIELLDPILKDEADMTLGLFADGRVSTDLAQVIAPNLSGQRALRRYILEDISSLDVSKYGVEIAITKYAKKNCIRTKIVYLKDKTHVMKEEKLGLVKGAKARIKMYFDIIKSMVSP